MAIPAKAATAILIEAFYPKGVPGYSFTRGKGILNKPFRRFIKDSEHSVFLVSGVP
jgi:hypothetical protein